MTGHYPPSLLGLVAAIGVAGAAHAIPPPPERSTTDCAAPVYATDTLVCSNPALLALDRAVQDRIARLDPKLLTSRPPYIEDQSAWFRRRSTCAFRPAQADCVAAAYAERIAVLDALAEAPQDQAWPMDCKPTYWSGGTKAITQGDHVILIDGEGTVRGVAMPMAPKAPWRPFARLKKEGESFSVQDVGNGKPLRCEPAD
ncbi:hypothetical protein ACFB49_03810 [Sphingomonas sp. DBB INV C78]|uniref:hypothetical protein n=1 Tax=Sphingomonas sp. DBB INV C78 TaxID=3349434 RepID=UPI0036D3A475